MLIFLNLHIFKIKTSHTLFDCVLYYFHKKVLSILSFPTFPFDAPEKIFWFSGIFRGIKGNSGMKWVKDILQGPKYASVQ